MGRLAYVGWIAIGSILAALSVPWFLWGSATTVAGLPVWLWWHVGWMVLASLVFWLFTRRAWGIGIESDYDETADAIETDGDHGSGHGGELR